VRCRGEVRQSLGDLWSHALVPMPPLVSEGALSSLSHRNPRACKRGAWRRRRARERPLQSVHLTRRCVGRSCGFSPSPSFRHPPFRTPTRNAQPDECVYAVSIDECAACGAYSIAPNRYRILLGGLCTTHKSVRKRGTAREPINERDTPYKIYVRLTVLVFQHYQDHKYTIYRH
jgi:hypothetical protein